MAVQKVIEIYFSQEVKGMQSRYIHWEEGEWGEGKECEGKGGEEKGWGVWKGAVYSVRRRKGMMISGDCAFVYLSHWLRINN